MTRITLILAILVFIAIVLFLHFHVAPQIDPEIQQRIVQVVSILCALACLIYFRTRR